MDLCRWHTLIWNVETENGMVIPCLLWYGNVECFRVEHLMSGFAFLLTDACGDAAYQRDIDVTYLVVRVIRRRQLDCAWIA